MTWLGRRHSTNSAASTATSAISERRARPSLWRGNSASDSATVEGSC